MARGRQFAPSPASDGIWVSTLIQCYLSGYVLIFQNVRADIMLIKYTVYINLIYMC